MAALDRIRLIGLLREDPAPAGSFYARQLGWTEMPSDIHHPLFARFFDRLSTVMEAEVGVRRDELLDGLSGRVLEIGAGNGMNFAHYPASVEEVVAIEPEPYLRGKADRAARSAPVRVTVRAGLADELEVGDDSFDGAVACLVLCTVSEQASALAELRRVLKAGGELRFLEHVRSSSPGKSRVQSIADRAGIWSRIAGGCHCARDTIGAIETAGFRITDVQSFDFGPSWGITNPHLLGRAIR